MKFSIGEFTIPNFVANSALCLLFGASRRGKALLRILKVREPEPSDHLVDEILERTSMANKLETVSSRYGTSSDAEENPGPMHVHVTQIGSSSGE